jgi:hypothetical protein
MPFNKKLNETSTKCELFFTSQEPLPPLIILKQVSKNIVRGLNPILIKGVSFFHLGFFANY